MGPGEDRNSSDVHALMQKTRGNRPAIIHAEHDWTPQSSWGKAGGESSQG
jgi:hypothetical protein